MRKPLFVAALGVIVVAQASALNFNLIYDAGINAQALQGFKDGAAFWSSRFSDPMTVNLQIGYNHLGAGILGQTSSSQHNYTYDQYRNALIGDKKSGLDNTVVNNLPTGSTYDFVINGTTTGNSNHWASSSNIRLTNANAKAVGLYSGNDATDASITFSSDFAFDFNHKSGTIDPSKYDFVGIAAHEIGHALGFISGVDILDGNAFGFSDSAFDPYHTSLDLFRYRQYSDGSGGTNNYRSWSLGNYATYFSVDGGKTLGPQFATGESYGDGWQASHWKDNMGIGIMDPTAAPGELLGVTQNDINAFDAIGYDIVPEPATMAALGLGLLGVLSRRRRK